MKRILVLSVLILLAFSFLLCACGTQNTPSVQGETITPKSAGIPWDQAKNHIGENTTVYGPVVSTKYATGSTGKPTFLNIGLDYPNPNRFTVVIWVEYRGNFTVAPEVLYAGKTIYVTGTIKPYQGSTEMEVESPSQIKTP
jgi:DNA/RNA endonuclease YhcR with UshA esterase domain